MEQINNLRLKTIYHKLYSYFLADNLRRTSSFLLASSAVGSIFGFAFWLLCAHLTSSVQIGYAASFLAYINLYSTITTLGLTNAVIRFLPHHKNKDAYFSTVLAITLITSLILGSFLIELIRFISPKLSFALNNPVTLALLLLILVISSLSSIADASLMANKASKNIFIKSLWQSPIKIMLPFVFISLGMNDILAIYALTTIIGFIYEMGVLFRTHHRRFKIDKSSLINSFRFTSGNFMGTIFGILPATLVPILVLNRLGASQAAYFYIAAQFASVLSIVSSSTAQAYLAEASNDQSSHYLAHLKKAAKNLYLLLIPAVIFMALVGTQILRIYGQSYYSHAAIVLVLLAIASLFIGFNWLGDSLLNVQKRPFAYGAMNLINALLVVLLVRLAANKGLIAIAAAIICAQALTVLIYLILQVNVLKLYVSGDFKA